MRSWFGLKGFPRSDYYPYQGVILGDEKTYIWSVEVSGYVVKNYKVNSLDLILNRYLRE